MDAAITVTTTNQPCSSATYAGRLTQTSTPSKTKRLTFMLD